MNWAVVIIVLFLFSPAQAEEMSTIEKDISQNVIHDQDDQFFTMAIENDSIGNGADQNYTNGIRFSYLKVNAAFPEIAHKIADQVPTFSINQTSTIFYSLGQNLYTPHDIDSRVQNPDDRPWAGFLYGSIGMATITDNHIDELEATLGVVGPLALGGPVQKAVHKHVTDSPAPNGWSNQLKNEPGVILSWQRRWPEALDCDAAGLSLTIAPYIGASLGNIYTYGSSGVSVRLRSSSSRWNDTPPRVRPAMPGTGFFETPSKNWDWSVFGGLEGRAVARNIFLDGNTFAQSHSVDKLPLVGDANAGVAFTLGRTRLSYTLVRRSREFKTQDSADLFGAVSLAYRF